MRPQPARQQDRLQDDRPARVARRGSARGHLRAQRARAVAGDADLQRRGARRCVPSRGARQRGQVGLLPEHRARRRGQAREVRRRARPARRPRTATVSSSPAARGPAACGRRRAAAAATTRPALAGASESTRVPSAATSGAALSRHSASSPSGVESATTPPPTPRASAVPAISNVRIATLSSRPATGLAKPIAPRVGAARGRLERRRSTCSACTFGAPVTEPGGNVARSSSPSPTPGAQPRRRHGRHEVPDAGVRPRPRGAEARHAPVRADPAQVVAHQVDDHHVLGRVLARRRARAAPRASPGARGRVPLIGDARTRVPVRRRNSSGESAEQRRRPPIRRTPRRRAEARCMSASQASSGDPSSRPASRRLRLTWNTSPAAIRSIARPTASAWPAGPGGRTRSGPACQGRAAAGAARRAPQLLAARLERGAAPGGHQGLEDAAPVGRQAQDMVVVGQEVGWRDGATRRGRRREALHARGEARGEQPDPAAAERDPGLARPGDGGRIVQRRERVLARPEDAHRLGAGDHVLLAAEPAARQDEGPAVVAHRARELREVHAGGQQLAVGLGRRHVSPARPLRCAHRAAAVRSVTPIASKTFVRCALTVFSEIPSRRAICLFGSPSATSRRTSRSRRGERRAGVARGTRHHGVRRPSGPAGSRRGPPPARHAAARPGRRP